MGKNRRGVVVIERGGSGALWLLVGGAIGAGLGLLFAPHSGQKTRQLLADRLEGLKEQAREAWEELSEDEDEVEEIEEGESVKGEGEEVLEESGEEIEETTEEEAAPRRSARAELEQRLARARARRRRELAEEDEEPVA